MRYTTKLIGALICAFTLNAGPLLPGNFVSVPTVPDTLGTGYLDFLLTPIEAPGSLQSVLTATVWDAPENPWLGGITFAYTLEASSFQNDELHRLSISGFEGFEVSVAQSAPVPGKEWVFASRDLNGNVVGAYIGLAPGELSQRLLVYTDSTDWGRVAAAAINGASVNIVTLGPGEAEDPGVPEPREWAMLAGLGLLGLAAYRRIKA